MSFFKCSSVRGTETFFQPAVQSNILCVLPDLLVGDRESFAERLGRVEPDRRVLLSGHRRLPRDGSGAHVQRAGDGGEQGVVARVWTDACGGGTLTSEARLKEQCVVKLRLDTYPAALWAGPWCVGRAL